MHLSNIALPVWPIYSTIQLHQNALEYITIFLLRRIFAKISIEKDNGYLLLDSYSKNSSAHKRSCSSENNL